MSTFEQALADAEAAAEATRKAAAALSKVAGRLKGSAAVGKMAVLKDTLPGIEKPLANLNEVARQLQERSANALEWLSADDDEEGRSFADRYAEEVCERAADLGVNVQVREGQLVCFPYVIRVVPRQRAVYVDKKRLVAIRPSELAKYLADSRRRPDPNAAKKFLRGLYFAYDEITKGGADRRLVKLQRPTVQLARIYKVMSAHPRFACSKADFSRDLFVLEYEGLNVTTNGATMTLHASSGTKQSGYFSYIGPDGQEAKYYSVDFRESD